jgi:diguanylate cyclase (GGDEF)-like protein
MEWEKLSENPLLVANYSLLKEIGILDYLEQLKVASQYRDELINEAYNIFLKESVDELVTYVIKCLSEKFIPVDLVFILNEGISINKIKVYAYHNMKTTKINLDLDSLEPYETFFRRYSGTTSFSIFEYELEDEEIIAPFRQFNPEIIVPIKGLSGLYGVIIFGPKVLSKEYSPAEIDYIDSLTKFTSVGIQNNIHYEHSVRDAKTGLYNHNFFVNRVNEEIARSRRTKNPFSLIVLDIDHFKNFNDTYGHLAGDEVIIRLAEVFKNTMREEDILSRFGGEEFTALLPVSGRDQALIAAERIRSAIEEMEVTWNNQILKVTISLGVSVYVSEDPLSDKSLLERADEALYKSKKNGRNRVTLYG